LYTRNRRTPTTFHGRTPANTFRKGLSVRTIWELSPDILGYLMGAYPPSIHNVAEHHSENHCMSFHVTSSSPRDCTAQEQSIHSTEISRCRFNHIQPTQELLRAIKSISSNHCRVASLFHSHLKEWLTDCHDKTLFTAVDRGIDEWNCSPRCSLGRRQDQVY
jgi:hypothetical protein